MPARHYAAKHRAPGRPFTPLTVFSDRIVGKKAIAVAAASGLVVAGGGPAFGSPVLAGEATSLAADARAVIGAQSLASVSQEAAWSLEVPTVTVVKAAPKDAVATQNRRRPSASTSTRGPSATVDRAQNIPQSVAGNEILEIAARYVGTPYVYGGSSPSGFDCSGFTQYVYAQLGKKIPRTDADQKAAGTIISAAEAQPGDIVWFPGHVGIYAGGNMMVDAPHTGTVVQFREMYRTPVFVRF